MEFKRITESGGKMVEKVYTGFQRVDRTTLTKTSMLVVAWFDGEPELWLVDGQAGVEQLRKFYRDEWGDRMIPFDTWTIHSTDRFSPLT